jgi:hypothetical protein
VDADTHYFPELLGVYERELHPALEEACAAKPTAVINLGGGNGYYAVGLGLRLPDAEVVVYESEPVKQDWIRRLAGENGRRVTLRGLCDVAELAACFAALPGGRGPGGVLVVSDIEGYEKEVLDPARVPPLAEAMLIVEVHGEDVKEALESRFRATHDVVALLPTPRGRDDFPWLPWYAAFSDPSYLLVERQGLSGWLWMKPRTGATSGP